MTTTSSKASRAPASIVVAVRLFAALRERAGEGRLVVRLPAGACVGDVWAALPPSLSASAVPDGLAYAVDHVWADRRTPLHHGAEVALLLPGSGG